MRHLYTILLFLISIQLVNAQGEKSLPPTKAVYIELGGAGLPYSFNYDFRFNKEKVDSWGMRVGFGGYSIEGDSFYSIPVMVNKLYGKGPHYFEMGFGATFLAFNVQRYQYQNCYTDSNGDYICENYGDTSTGTSFILDIDGSPSVMGVLNFGYRRVPVDGGFTWKVNLNPIFNNNGFWPLFAGVGFGYSF